MTLLQEKGVGMRQALLFDARSQLVPTAEAAQRVILHWDWQERSGGLKKDDCRHRRTDQWGRAEGPSERRAEFDALRGPGHSDHAADISRPRPMRLYGVPQ